MLSARALRRRVATVNDPKRVGVVVTCSAGVGHLTSEHERITQFELAQRMSTLKSYDFGGAYDRGQVYAGHVYFVPSGTLLTEHANQLGIHGVGA